MVPLNIALISVPYDLDRYGQGMGAAPAAYRAAGLERRLRASNLNIAKNVAISGDLGLGDTLARLGKLQQRIAVMVKDALTAGLFPVILGGDCCTAIGVWSAISQTLPSRQIGIAWFDAHGDWNTEETTRSGYLGGMPYAAICGHGNLSLRRAAGMSDTAAPRLCSLLGVRDLDPPEAALLATTPVTQLSPETLRSNPRAAIQPLLDAGAFYLHFDVDVLALAEAPGVAFPVPGGLTSSEATRLVEQLVATTPPAALSLTAADPDRDPTGRTIETAINLLVRMLSAIQAARERQAEE